jgi:adenine deaminase
MSNFHTVLWSNSTWSWGNEPSRNIDENTLMVVGSDDQDMARCANVLLEAGGSMAIVNRGEILEKIEFPFGGIFSLHPWPRSGAGLRRIQKPLGENGLIFR